MLVLAHVGHWLVSLVYAAPALLLGGALGVQRAARAPRGERAKSSAERLGRELVAQVADALPPVAVDEHRRGGVLVAVPLRPDPVRAPDRRELRARADEVAHAPDQVLPREEPLDVQRRIAAPGRR